MTRKSPAVAETAAPVVAAAPPAIHREKKKQQPPPQAQTQQTSAPKLSKQTSVVAEARPRGKTVSAPCPQCGKSKNAQKRFCPFCGCDTSATGTPKKQLSGSVASASVEKKVRACVLDRINLLTCSHLAAKATASQEEAAYCSKTLENSQWTWRGRS